MRRREDYVSEAVALVLAGGRGTRLHGLTEWRAKPAMPFAGGLRIVDFTLSNCFNSGVRRVGVLTQYHPFDLIRHLRQGWGCMRGELGECLDVLPASERSSCSEWYGGTADAVRQNLDWLDVQHPRWVLVLSGDHVYRMDYRELVAWHAREGAAVTVGCVEVGVDEASGFGVMRLEGSRVVELVEKPVRPEALAVRPGVVLASMGVYVFDYEHLRACLGDERAGARRDFARDVLPRCIATGSVAAYSMAGTRWPYWRDVGTVDAYWHAQMDLVGKPAGLELRDPQWPVWGDRCASGGVRFEAPERGCPALVDDALIAPGCTVASAVIRRSVAGPDARVDRAVVEDSVLLRGSEVGAGSLVRRAVIDEGCRLPPGSVVDATRAETRGAGYHVTPGGVVVVTAQDLARHRAENAQGLEAPPAHEAA